MRIAFAVGICALTIAPAARLGGQQRVPIRTVAVPSQSSEHLGSLPSVRHLPDGRVLVNDPFHRRIVVFDSTLATMTVTADSTGTSGAAYPTGRLAAPLIRFAGDSTLLTDLEAQSFIVIDPKGHFARSMAHLRAQDLETVSMQYSGVEGVDGQGRLIYRAILSGRPPRPEETRAPQTRDTVAIVRADFNARRIDTVASFTTTRPPSPVFTTAPDGKRSAVILVNPMPQAPDDWVVMSDGTIAVIRSHDYHVDFTMPDGRRLSGPKLPFDWRRVTDDEKRARVDSLKRVVDSIAAAGRPYATMYSSRPSAPGDRSIVDTIIPTVSYVPLAEIPDYVPPIRAGAMKPDADGNAWILPATSSQARGGLLYDVVNSKGELTERVQLPPDRALAGFGRGGVVYLARYDRTGKFWLLERTRVVR